MNFQTNLSFQHTFEKRIVPELPEVETMRRGILSVEGSTLLEIKQIKSKLKPLKITPKFPALRKRMLGATITRLDRIGKRLIFVFDNSDRLVIEPRMTGLILLSNPPNESHLRLHFQLQQATNQKNLSSLYYWDRRGLGTITLYTEKAFQATFFPPKVGQDALTITSETLYNELRLRNRAIKVALLDQKHVAGVGNIYASEILHLAKIHPEKLCKNISEKGFTSIHQAMLEILNAAILSEGSTLSDGTYRNALNRDGSYQNQHRVYAKHDSVCTSCNTGTIQRIVQAQRSTFFCPVCQPKSNR